MGGEWTLAPLEDSVESLIDYRGKTPRKTASGVPLITAKIVKAGRIDTPNEFIAEEDYEAWMRRGIPLPGDVLITTEAPLGEVAQLGKGRVALAQRLIALRGRRGVLHNTFLKFLLQSEPVQDQLRARASGTTVLGIKQSELRKVVLRFPEYDEQRAIAHILGTLDDKIELNRRMSETLEAMARELFKSWFVDFDPVRAKAEGRDPALPAHIAGLFPDSFEDSELGEIPMGWQVTKLGDILRLSRNSLSPGNFPAEVFDHYSIPAYDEGHGPKPETGAAIRSNKHLVPRDSVLFSKLNPRIPRIWRPEPASDRRSICSTEFLVALPKGGWTRDVVFGLLTSSKVLSEIGTLVTGTSGSHQRVRPEAVLDVQVISPPASIRAQLDVLLNRHLDRAARCRNESRTLAALRDTLLPKLISGDLRVKDAERFLSEVT